MQWFLQFYFSIFLVLALMEKIYQTANQVIDDNSKDFKFRQKYTSMHCISTLFLVLGHVFKHNLSCFVTSQQFSEMQRLTASQTGSSMHFIPTWQTVFCNMEDVNYLINSWPTHGITCKCIFTCKITRLINTVKNNSSWEFAKIGVFLLWLLCC